MIAVEKKAFLKAFGKHSERICISGFDTYIYEKNGIRVVMIFSGAGEILAAAATQALICTYSPDVIINAGDAGREGELIQRWIYKMLDDGKERKYKRLWVSALTRKAILKANKNLIDMDAFDDLYKAGETRIIPRQDRKESCRLADAMEYGFATSSTVKAKNREVIPSGSRMAKKLAKTIIIIIAARETEGVNPTKEAYTTARSAHEIDPVRFDTPIRLNMP